MSISNATVGALGIGQIPFAQIRTRLVSGAVEIGRGKFGNVAIGGVDSFEVVVAKIGLLGQPVIGLVGILSTGTNADLIGRAFVLSQSTVTPTAPKPTPLVEGGYANIAEMGFGDMAKALREKKVNEEIKELLIQEDMLLLAMIKSTLENPKYGF